jgi:hypothetical protein
MYVVSCNPYIYSYTLYRTMVNNLYFILILILNLPCIDKLKLKLVDRVE